MINILCHCLSVKYCEFKVLKVQFVCTILHVVSFAIMNHKCQALEVCKKMRSHFSYKKSVFMGLRHELVCALRRKIVLFLSKNHSQREKNNGKQRKTCMNVNS